MDLRRVLSQSLITTQFQPIVDLDTDTVVAYEALSRGPVGELAAPDVLFETARREGLLAELDEQCRNAALTNAISAQLGDPQAIFINVEPEVIDVGSLEGLIDIARQVPSPVQVVLEITERAISARPAELLAVVQRLRQAGWRIALDDVGADDMALAFMPLLRPDIIKLDLSLVQQRPNAGIASVMNAVNAHAQRTGAVLLAEGIETAAHLEIARALGARLGQGWLFGKPAHQPDGHRPAGSFELPTPQSRVTVATSPFDCLPSAVPLRRSTKPLLVEVSKHLEQEALRHGSSCIVLTTFQFAEHFTSATAQRYQKLAEAGGFVAVLANGLELAPAQQLRGVDTNRDDPLVDEWDVVVLAPHFAAALLARDVGDDGPDRQRRFDFVLTYDWDVVCAAAESLMMRVAPHERATAPSVV